MVRIIDRKGVKMFTLIITNDFQGCTWNSMLEMFMERFNIIPSFIECCKRLPKEFSSRSFQQALRRWNFLKYLIFVIMSKQKRNSHSAKHVRQMHPNSNTRFLGQLTIICGRLDQTSRAGPSNEPNNTLQSYGYGCRELGLSGFP